MSEIQIGDVFEFPLLVFSYQCFYSPIQNQKLVLVTDIQLGRNGLPVWQVRFPVSDKFIAENTNNPTSSWTLMTSYRLISNGCPMLKIEGKFLYLYTTSIGYFHKNITLRLKREHTVLCIQRWWRRKLAMVTLRKLLTPLVHYKLHKYYMPGGKLAPQEFSIPMNIKKLTYKQ